MKHFDDAWGDAEGIGTKEIMDGLGMRAEALVKGVPFGGTWKLDKRKKIMVAALVASHIAMKTEADLEKYATCGSGTMCLHFPSFFGDDNNMAYGLGEDVKSAYKGLVMTKYPGAKRDRFHIMSPCKTDLVVEAHEDDGFCKCEVLHTADKVVYKLQKFRCILKGTKMTAPINADGTCPEKYTWHGNEYEIISDMPDDMHTDFSCDADEDLDDCIYDFMHEDPCTADVYDDGCLKDEYRNCYDDYGGKGNYYCDNDGGNCDAEGHCVGAGSNMATHPPVPLSKHQDTFAIPVNAKENIITGEMKPVTVCTNSWAKDIFGSTNTDHFRPCVSVAYDTVSMRGYSKGGFGVNYCAENKADFKDTLEKTCFWGGIAGAVAVSALSGGVTGTVLVPVAIGSGSVACEKILNMGSKWPHDQY